VIVDASGKQKLFSPEEFYDLATTVSFRAHKINKMRLEPPRKRANPPWAVRELLYHATIQNEDLADAVLVVRLDYGLAGGHVSVSTPLPGRRIVRLRYVWSDIEPYLHMKPRDLSNDILTKMAQPGGILRARVRHARGH
jgi:hypothetical protein